MRYTVTEGHTEQSNDRNFRTETSRKTFLKALESRDPGDGQRPKMTWLMSGASGAREKLFLLK